MNRKSVFYAEHYRCLVHRPNKKKCIRACVRVAVPPLYVVFAGPTYLLLHYCQRVYGTKVTIGYGWPGQGLLSTA